MLNHGGNPDAEHAPLPAGLAGSLNLSQVGMFGWSLGGAASAQAMHDDPRIKAAINMDGTFWGPLAQEGVNRPFLLLTGSEHTEQIDPTLASFLAASTGPKLHLALADSKHRTFSDGEELEPELAPELGLTPTRSRRWSAPSTRRPPSPTSAPTSRRSSASTCAAVTTTCSTARRRASPTSRSSPDHPDSQR